jgi:hypothetical protein
MRWLALALVLTGCHNGPQPCSGACGGGDMASAPADLLEALDVAVAPPGDMAEAPDLLTQADLAPPADMTLVPPYFFDPTIQNDINALGCASSSCHASTSRILVPNPKTAADVDNNYQALLGDSQAGATSLLLTKNLATSGVVHAAGITGTKPFLSTSDPTYQRWLVWINAGAVERQ